MSASPNLDLGRSIYAAWERGDFSSAEWAHPEIALVIIDGPSPGRWTGLAGMTGRSREYLNAWEEFRQEAKEYRELDDERVLVLDRRTGRGKTSRVDVGDMRAKGAHLFHVRDGKVAKIGIYLIDEHARTDLGLAREAGSPNP